jgi:hypothetical protein
MMPFAIALADSAAACLIVGPIFLLGYFLVGFTLNPLSGLMQMLSGWATERKNRFSTALSLSSSGIPPSVCRCFSCDSGEGSEPPSPPAVRFVS